MTCLNEVDTERNISMNFVGKIVLSSLSLIIYKTKYMLLYLNKHSVILGGGW